MLLAQHDRHVGKPRLFRLAAREPARRTPKITSTERHRVRPPSLSCINRTNRRSVRQAPAGWRASAAHRLGCSARRHPKVCTAASPHGLTSRLSGQGHRQVVINDPRSHFIRGVIPHAAAGHRASRSTAGDRRAPVRLTASGIADGRGDRRPEGPIGGCFVPAVRFWGWLENRSGPSPSGASRPQAITKGLTAE